MEYGACYYPEHWPRERWDLDAKLMKEAGFTIIRLAEFAWARLEPVEGRFDFAWLDEAIDLFAEHDIRVILGTPTAGPPAWLMDKHPDIYQQDAQGHVKGFGTRRHYCFNNDHYHVYTRSIVTQMAKHYMRNDNVVAWQIDNELGGIQTTRCFCSDCRAAFQRWLQDRYGSLDEVNEAWGTIFSSQTFNRWEQVHLPAYSVHQAHNPGLMLDFNRFSSDSVVRYQRMQAQILREYCPQHIVTTNFMGSYSEMNYYKLAEDLDVVALDSYPNLKRVPAERAFRIAANLDMTRGYKRQNFWVMEHQSGAPGGGTMAPTPRPGELRRWTYQSVARGADAILYFRWRTVTFALEQYWHGILQHHGQPGRLYEEVKQVGAELAKLAPFMAGTELKSKAAIVRCFDNEWAFGIQPHTRGYDYKDHLTAYYRYFHEQHIQVDIISPGSPLDEYDLVIIPNLMMSEPGMEAMVYDYVRGGGHVVMDFRTGAKEWNNRMLPKRLPGPYAELLGISIEDYGVIDSNQAVSVTFTEEAAAQPVPPYQAGVWYDVISLHTARMMIAFDEDYFAGSPAATCNDYGSGKAYYAGTELHHSALRRWLNLVCEEAGIQPVLKDLPAEVEAVSRSRGETQYIFLINHHSRSSQLTLPNTYMDLLSGREVSGELELQVNDILVLSEMREG